MNELVSFATQYGQIQKRLLRELELPHALLDDTGKVIWTNVAFENIIHQPKGYNKTITALFPSITRDKLPDNEGVEEAQYELTYDSKEYIAKFKRISLKEMAETEHLTPPIMSVSSFLKNPRNTLTPMQMSIAKKTKRFDLVETRTLKKPGF